MGHLRRVPLFHSKNNAVLRPCVPYLLYYVFFLFTNQLRRIKYAVLLIPIMTSRETRLRKSIVLRVLCEGVRAVHSYVYRGIRQISSDVRASNGDIKIILHYTSYTSTDVTRNSGVLAK